MSSSEEEPTEETAPVPKPRPPPPPKPCRHTLCRLETALLRGVEHEPVPIPVLLQEVQLKDLDPAQLERLRGEVAKAVVGDGDARYIQLYASCLLRGVDFMETAVLEDGKAQELLHRLSLAILSAKAHHTPADVQIPLWAVIVAASCLLLLVVLMVVFFSVVIAKVSPPPPQEVYNV